jgi:hypothetical protein
MTIPDPWCRFRPLRWRRPPITRAPQGLIQLLVYQRFYEAANLIPDGYLNGVEPRLPRNPGDIAGVPLLCFSMVWSPSASHRRVDRRARGLPRPSPESPVLAAAVRRALGEQLVHLMADHMPAGLDTTVISISGGVGLEARRLRIGEAGGNVGLHDRPVRLQCEQPLAATLGHQLRGLILAMDRVAGDQHTVQVEQAEQGAGSGDFVAALCTATWPSTTRLSQAKAVTTCSGEAAAARTNERHRILPSIANTPRPTSPRVSRKPLKPGRKSRRIEQTKQPREGIVAGQAVLQFKELLEQSGTVTRKVGETHTSFCATDRRHGGNRQHFKQVMPLCIAAARIQIFEPEEEFSFPNAIPLQPPPQMLMRL